MTRDLINEILDSVGLEEIERTHPEDNSISSS